MAYTKNTADIINLILQGSTNVESIIRANSLDQMTAPAANLSMNSKRLTTMAAGIVSTDAPDLSQLAGIQLPYVISGCIWTWDNGANPLTCSMTAGTVNIKGIQLTVAAVTSRAFTASDDTYVDFADNGDGTANITYTAVTNLTTSPALANSGTALNTLRNAVISAGASSVAANGICQGSIASTSNVNPASLLSTTIAAGSTTQTIGTNPLNLAAVTHAPTGGGYIVWTAAGNGEQAILSYTGVSGSTLTGTTVLAGRAAATYTTGDTVKGTWPVGVTDTIGNRIFRTNPLGGVSGSGTTVNAFTNTSTTGNTFVLGASFSSSAGWGLYTPFLIPAGGGRQIRVSLLAPYLASSAVAGTEIPVNCWLDGSTSIATADPTVSVTSDGVSLNLVGFSGLLAPGLHTFGVTISQAAAGTMTLSLLFATTYLIVELV